jgi:hypothetical protein
MLIIEENYEISIGNYATLSVIYNIFALIINIYYNDIYTCPPYSTIIFLSKIFSLLLIIGCSRRNEDNNMFCAGLLYVYIVLTELIVNFISYVLYYNMTILSINIIYMLNTAIYFQYILLENKPKVYIKCIRILFGICIINYCYKKVKLFYNKLKLIKEILCLINFPMRTKKCIIECICNFKYITCCCKTMPVTRDLCQICPICLEKLDNDIIKLIQCNHLLHEKCMQEYLKSVNIINNKIKIIKIKCPTCRQESSMWIKINNYT